VTDELIWLGNAFLLDPQIIGRIKGLTPLDFSHSSENLAFLLDVSAKFWNRRSLTVSYCLLHTFLISNLVYLQLENFFQFFNDVPAVQNRNPKLIEAHRHFKNLFRTYKKENAFH
jgi:hypothetical protein